MCSTGSTAERKFFHSWEALVTIEAWELRWRSRRRFRRKPMHMQLWSGALFIADIVKVFNPQSPQARAIFDLTIVVIAVIVVILAVVVGIAGRKTDADCRDSVLLATAAATGSWVFLS